MEKHATLLDSIQVCVVDSKSVTVAWNELHMTIKSAECIAIDLEMSGIGSRKSLRESSVDERYSNLRQSATDHSILSIGIACFNTVEAKSELNKLTINSTVFDVMLFSRVPYTIDPLAVSFLLRHGFDFTSQYRYGLPYIPAFCTGEPHNGDDIQYSLRELFLELLRKPIILHNGLIDLVFLYHHFYAPLPNSLSVFVADLSEMFPGGLYDTKRIPISTITEQPTYLEYLLHKSWQINCSNCSNGRRHIVVEMTQSVFSETVRLINRSDNNKCDNGLPDICEDYASYGFCSQLSTCSKSHNISHVIAEENGVRKDQHNGDASVKNEDTCVGEVPLAEGEHGIAVPRDETKRRKRKRKRDKKKSLEKMFSNELAKAKKRLSIEEQEKRQDDVEGPGDLEGPNGNGDLAKRQRPNRHERSDVPVTINKPNDGRLVNTHPQQTTTASCSHKSGCDAFATGFYFLQSALTRASSDDIITIIDQLVSIHSEYKNKVNINGKPMPLLITKSLYCNNSINHKKIQLNMK